MTDRLELERRIEARPETVFSYLTDRDRYTRWMGVRAELDARPGGVYRVEVEQGGIALGEFVEVDPPHRVVFTWGWDGDPDVPPGSTTVEITLEPDGAGTLVRLVHSGLPGAPAVELHRSGWELYLGRLVEVALHA